MGLFYANLTVHRPSREALLNLLRQLGRTAFLGPTAHDFTAVFDRANDVQDAADIERLGCEVTGRLSCSALAAVLHDDDVLYLWLFRDGRVLDTYDSLPGYFEPAAEPGAPSGGDGHLLCEAFGRPDRQERVDRLLRANLLDDELPEIGGELGRHRAIAEELGMPPFVAGLGYAAIAGGYVPEKWRDTTFEPVDHPA